MAKLILVRHGQSTWNAANRFTGWVDVPLNRVGRLEAIEAAKKLSPLNSLVQRRDLVQPTKVWPRM